DDALGSYGDDSGEGSGGLTSADQSDLGISNPSDLSVASASTPLPALAGAQMGMITVSPTSVTRQKCPRGYTFITVPGRVYGTNGTCVLTKVARALGLARKRRGRGISARDLRAALRVQRLVHRLAPKMGVHRSSAPRYAFQRRKR